MAREKPIEQVIEENREHWTSIKEVQGVTATERDSEPIIRVLVSKLTPALREQLPQEQDGYSLMVYEVSDIESDNPNADVDVHPPEEPT